MCASYAIALSNVCASVTQEFIDHATAHGLTIREYHLDPGRLAEERLADAGHPSR